MCIRDSDFNALAFTDSRSRYQFYNLGRLWPDLAKARAADLKLLHLCTCLLYTSPATSATA